MRTVDYFVKLEQNPYEDLFWNLPEVKQGSLKVVGGCRQNFRNVVKIAEYAANNLPLAEVRAVLPEALQSSLPKLANWEFLPSNEVGALSGEGLERALREADFNVLIGDFSRHKATGQAVAAVLGEQAVLEETAGGLVDDVASGRLAVNGPGIIVTRDTVDLLADHQPEAALNNPQLILLATLVQLKKLLAAVFYPRMLMASQSLLQVAEVLHKFTLSYPVVVVTLVSGQIVVATGGKVQAVALVQTKYSPISLWSGELAVRIAALNLFNPRNRGAATCGALFW